jgi:hypothetical protein
MKIIKKVDGRTIEPHPENPKLFSKPLQLWQRMKHLSLFSITIRFI